MPYQIHQYSLNVGSMNGLNYEDQGSWRVDLESPPKDLALIIKKAIEDIAFPFFEKFTTLEEARDALSSNHS